jgi:hypothetical protein
VKPRISTSLASTLGGEQGQRYALQQLQVDFGQEQMDVPIDQPGHQCAPVEVDTRRCGAPDRPVGHLLDVLVLDQHLDTVDQRIASRIEQASAMKQILCHAFRYSTEPDRLVGPFPQPGQATTLNGGPLRDGPGGLHYHRA